MTTDINLLNRAYELGTEYDYSSTVIFAYLLDGYTEQQILDAIDVSEALCSSLANVLADVEPILSSQAILVTIDEKPKRKKYKPRVYR